MVKAACCSKRAAPLCSAWPPKFWLAVATVAEPLAAGGWGSARGLDLPLGLVLRREAARRAAQG